MVAGKGHETGQYVAGTVLPFDDRQVTAEALERLARGSEPPWPAPGRWTGDPPDLGPDRRYHLGQCRGDPAAVVAGEVVIDSRRAGDPGGLFAAVAGERADGHDFAAAAVAAGAVAVLATRPGPVPASWSSRHPGRAGRAGPVRGRFAAALAIAGITGSSGKTTTKDLAAQLADASAPRSRPPGRSTTSLAIR